MLLPSGSPQTWHSVVADGSLLHVFFALTGQWSTYTFASPPSVTMGRFCFLVSDGSAVFGVSSFHGSLVPWSAPGATAARAEGNVGIATSPGMIHGFSAAKNTWASLPVANAPTVTIGNSQPAFVAIQDGAAISLFSGHTGTFTTLPAAPSATVQLERYVAVVVDGTTVYGYSALLGRHATLHVAAPPTAAMQQMFALADDGAFVTAFSAATGTFATPFPAPGSGAQVVTRAQIAVVTANGAAQPYGVYSSYRNRWDSVPVLTSPATYFTTVSMVLVEAGGGVYGWSQRGSGWIHEPTGVIDTVVVGSNPPNTAETIFLRSGTTLYTFNPRTEAWRSTTTAVPATLVRAHYLALLAQDGTNAYGFSVWNDHWSVQPLQAPYVTGTAQVQSAYVTDGIAIYAYGGFGQLSLTGEFPDFYRAATRGSLLTLLMAAEPATVAVLAMSSGAASIPLPIGTLLLDPQHLIVVTAMGIPNAGPAGLTLQIPDDPALSGLTVHCQALIAGASTLYLTNSVFPTIF